MGGATPGQVACVACMRKQASEPQKQTGQQHSFMVSTSVLFSKFLPQLPSVMECDLRVLRESSPFFPRLLLVMVFCHSNRHFTRLDCLVFLNPVSETSKILQGIMGYFTLKWMVPVTSIRII